jgi:hypothetical protein
MQRETPTGSARGIQREDGDRHEELSPSRRKLTGIEHEVEPVIHATACTGYSTVVRGMQIRHVLGLHGDDPALGSPFEADTDAVHAKLACEPAQLAAEVFRGLGANRPT